MKYCEKLSFRVENIVFSPFFFRAAQKLSRGPRTMEHARVFFFFFFRITSKILKFGTCNFTIIESNIKAIFRGYFNSLRFD